MTKRFYPRGAVALLLLLGLICHFTGGNVALYGIPTILLFTGLVVFRKSRRKAAPPRVSSRIPPPPETGQLLTQSAQKNVSEETSGVQISALGSAQRRREWQQIESAVDELLDRCIKLIRAKVNAHTVAIFFPANDGGYRLRKYCSTCEHINKEAVIYPGVGVIGAFLKDGLKQLNLQEIVSDSMTLYYYNRDAGIRSLMASPIIAEGIERGTIIVDSTNKKNFSDEDHAYLTTIATVLAQAVYYAYLYTEHRIEHIRLAAMSSIEKEFFRNLSIDSILDKMTEIIPFALGCDRLTISIRNDQEPSATVLRTWGAECDDLLNRQFSLKEKSLASLLYAKNICIFRNYSQDHYETRYFDGELSSETLTSFLAVPIGVDTCKGMILVESTVRNGFSDSNRDLISRIATSAGLAIEKIQIFDTANKLATHDGLTGLFNHRQFQLILKDEITRSIRYNDPLSLVICDIDFFKKVNDTYGHQFGDTVLKGVAARLESSIREGIDTSARYGGEEFALVLVKTDEASAIETVERIRQQIGAMLFKGPTGQDVHVTMSFGIAVYRQHARQLNELIKKADKALYRAKENGRNRVEVF